FLFSLSRSNFPIFGKLAKFFHVQVLLRIFSTVGITGRVSKTSEKLLAKLNDGTKNSDASRYLFIIVSRFFKKIFIELINFYLKTLILLAESNPLDDVKRIIG